MKRNKQLVIVLIFLFLIYPSARSSSEGGGSIGTGNIDDIAKAIATYFPKATGNITAVNQDIVQIQSEKEAGLAEGALLSVYRAGHPFYHPVTDVVLGNFEQEIGYLEVTKVQMGQITARVIGEIAPVLIGDMVRITAARIPISISGGATEEDRFLIHELGLALEETGRFAIAKAPLYSITLTHASHIVNIQMKNVKTGKIVSDMATTLQAVQASDSLFESLQYRLFEKQQQGIAVK